VAIENLRCEYLVKPLGIDILTPRLSWELKSKERGQKQLAYQVLVASDSISLSKNMSDVWDSGKVESNQTNQITFNGNKVQSQKFYYWKVRVWDMNGNVSDWSSIEYWSMGLLNRDDWKAKWIGPEAQNVPRENQYNNKLGYKSDISTKPNMSKWIIVDLGKVETFEEIQLYPAQFEKDNFYLFPKKFRIDISDNIDFHEFSSIANEDSTDFITNKGFYDRKFEKIRARYVKLLVTELEKMDSINNGFVGLEESEERYGNNLGNYGFALSELKILNGKGENLAFEKLVTVSDPQIYNDEYLRDNWSKESLVDGFLKVNENSKSYNTTIPPSPLLRKEFSVIKKMKRALLYVSSLGAYEARINGEKVGDHILAPEFTDYHRRVQYQVYDVTEMLRKGKNAIGAILADGWYSGEVWSHPGRGSFGFDRRLIGQLSIDYIDGTNETIKTDDSWKLSNNSPVVAASIFDGEKYNANYEQEGWDQPEFNDNAWKEVTLDTSVDIGLSSQMNEPIKIIEKIRPVEVFKISNQTYIFDLGQNIAGWVELSLPYNPGGNIVFRYGERLNSDRTLYTANLRGAKQTDSLITSDKEDKVNWEPMFTYHGFRYVEISGLTEPPKLENVLGKVVASASLLVSNFETSNSDLNQLWQNILWTQRGNMHSIPTDCPQRDERAGWMGDAQVFSQAAIFNLDMAPFFTKWVRDIRDSQTKDGRFPDIAPHPGYWQAFYNSPGWGDAGIIVPWKLYLNYGDITVLDNQFPAMEKFVQSIIRYNPDLIWHRNRGNMYGDWLNGDTIKDNDYPNEGGKIPNDVYSTAFFAYSVRIISNVAKVLGRLEAYKFYESLAKDIQNTFVAEFIDANGIIKGDTQAGYAMALAFGLVPDSLKSKAVSNMVNSVKSYDYRMSTGIQSTIRLMNQLSKYGHSDIAYRLLESRRFPSWLYSIDQGATTIWERWDGYVEGRGFQNPGMNSFNHYAIGAVSEWMFRNIVGINNDITNPGYNHFTISPIPGGSINWAKGSYHAIVGEIVVDWKKGNNDNIDLQIKIPVNTTATVIIPAGPGKNIIEGGVSLDKVSDIKLVDRNNENITLLVNSGNYKFKVFN
tara:strand:+ start:7357 stop:10629 length:3273 start_codon:yes stop_codon:yes gene_type:complete